jgi:hypothetical protein
MQTEKAQLREKRYADHQILGIEWSYAKLLPSLCSLSLVRQGTERIL